MCKLSKARHFLFAGILSILLIAGIAALTNSLDTQRFSWDFIYYISMAQNGFEANNLASPFAYRYLSPLIIYFFTHFFGIPFESGFRIMAYAGAFLQLFGVFWFTNWLTHSTKGSYIALLATAFSLFNVKFLLFDIYRPDHLAYFLVLLQTYFAFKRKFVPLFILTMIASQIREFNLIPLIAYLWAFAMEKDRSVFSVELIVSVIGLAVATILPRILIPVHESFQFADLNLNGILRVVIAPFVIARDVNFIYSLLAYFLPILMLVSLKQIITIVQSLGSQIKLFMTVYTVLVLIFSFLGGTDFYRFSTYLFLPQAVILGFASQTSPRIGLLTMLISVFIFNRIWMHFPMSDLGSYLDFYGASATRLNWNSVLRIAECLGFILMGYIARSHWPFKSSMLPRFS